MNSSTPLLSRFSLLAALLGMAAPVSALTYTWDGSVSNLWSTGANWSTALPAPLNDDELVFPAAGANKSMSNDLTYVEKIHRMTFSGSGYTLNGNTISLASAIGTPLLRVTHTSGTTSLNSPITLGEDSTFSTVAGGILSSSFFGEIALGTHTLTLDSDGSMDLRGSISGDGGVTCAGAGVVTLGGLQLYTGPTAVNSGRLNILTTGTISASTIIVAPGATLSNTGSATVAAVTASGTVSPGVSNFAKLTATGAVNFNAATSVLALDLGTNLTPGTTYDQLVCQGSVTINSGTDLALTAAGTFTPTNGQAYTLLSKTSAGAISGTFNGLPNGGTMPVGNKLLQVFYTGGDGNDLTATVVTTLPTITDVTDRTINEDLSTGVISFTVGDAAGETAAESLTVTRASSNLTLVPLGNIVLGGSGASRTVRVTPAANQSGTTTITLTVTDTNGGTASESFLLTVNPINDPPTATGLSASESYTEDTPRNLADIEASDVDHTTLTATLTLSVPAAGSLTAGTSGSVTSTYNAATGVWTASGLTADVNAQLAAVSFVPKLNYNTGFTIATSISDGVAAPVTGIKTVSGNAVNDQPTLDPFPDLDIDEDAGLLTVNITGIGTGADNEVQLLTVTATSSNTALIPNPSVSYTSPAATGTLTFTPVANASGTAIITVRVRDGLALNNQRDQTFSVTVNPLPEPLAATNLSTPETYVEDTALDVANIVISDAAGGTATATLTLSNPAAGSLTTSTSGAVTSTYNATTGVWMASGAMANVNSCLAAVVFDPAVNFNATFTIATHASDGVSPAVTGSKTMTGTPVNDPPTLNFIANPVRVTANTGLQTVALAGIGTGAPDEVQTLTFTAFSSVTTIIPHPAVTYTSPDATGSLSFTPVPGTTGSVEIIVTVNDGQQSTSQLFIVQVRPPNQPPSFTPGPNVTAPTGVGAVRFLDWATNISTGASGESSQTLQFEVMSNSNAGLFSVPPAVAADVPNRGTLSFSAAPGASGTATIGLRLRDNGGTESGGVDTSPVVNFTITLTELPPPPPLPSINAGGTGSGTASLEWNFDGISTAPEFWVDNHTIPGWYAQMNNGSTPNGIFQPSDGTTALTGLINCGNAGSTDRAPGSKCTAVGGFASIAYAVVVQNTGSLPVRLSRLRYAQELWRSSLLANGVERVVVFAAVSSAPLASIASGTDGFGDLSPGAGFSALPAGASTRISSSTVDTALDGNLPTNRSAVDFSPAAGALPVILPGQFLTLKWTDPNESHNDGHQAIDDVTLDFTELPCGIQASATLERRPVAVPPDGSADTVDVSLTVIGAGTISPSGWRIVGGPLDGSTGAYGAPTLLSIPLAAISTSTVLAVQDAVDAACTTSLTISPAPIRLLGLFEINGTTRYLQSNTAATAFLQTSISSDPAGIGATEVTVNASSGTLLTDAVTLTPGSEKCVTITLEAQDTSTGTGFEANDTVKVELLTFGPQDEVETLTHDFDINGDGVVSGGPTPLEEEFNTRQQPFPAQWTSTFRLVGTIPADATSFRLRITAAADSSTEFLRFRNLTLSPCVDTDGDGITDAWEWAHGTNPNSAASVFVIQDLTSNGAETTLTLPTVSEFDYQLLNSQDLAAWSRDGIPVAGDGTPKALTGPNTGSRTFRRVLVLPAQTVQP